MHLCPYQNLLNLVCLRGLLPPFSAFAAIKTLKLDGEMSEFLPDFLFLIARTRRPCNSDPRCQNPCILLHTSLQLTLPLLSLACQFHAITAYFSLYNIGFRMLYFLSRASSCFVGYSSICPQLLKSQPPPRKMNLPKTIGESQVHTTREWRRPYHILHAYFHLRQPRVEDCCDSASISSQNPQVAMLFLIAPDGSLIAKSAYYGLQLAREEMAREQLHYLEAMAVYCATVAMVEEYQQAVSVAIGLEGIRDLQMLFSQLGLRSS